MHKKFKERNFNTALRKKLIETGINKEWLDKHLIIEGFDKETKDKLNKKATKIINKRKGTRNE